MNMVEEFVNSVLIIDDKPEEVKDLEKVLSDNDIAYRSFTPETIKTQSFHKNRQVLFMDILMNDNQADLAGNIATIRNILKQIVSDDFGMYGLVLWTKHSEDIEPVKEKISIDNKNRAYNTPAFIVGLDKTKYMTAGSYDTVLNDLNAELEKDKAAQFFINWSISVSKAKDKAISDIYRIVPEYDKQNTDLLYLFYLLAQNHTGIPEKQIEDYKGFSHDAYKAFDEMLYSDLINQQKNLGGHLFEEKPQNPRNENFADEISKLAKINSKLFIDNSNLDQNVIVPGNVYVIKDEKSLSVVENVQDGISIAIELTPPCDFSNKKKNSRIIGGFIYDCQEGKKELKKQLSDLKADNRYLLWPIEIGGKNKIVCFDYRYLATLKDDELKDATKYELSFQVTHKLFADVLQKFSSHAARLGLSNIMPNLKTPTSQQPTK